MQRVCGSWRKGPRKGIPERNVPLAPIPNLNCAHPTPAWRAHVSHNCVRIKVDPESPPRDDRVMGRSWLVAQRGGLTRGFGLAVFLGVLLWVDTGADYLDDLMRPMVHDKVERAPMRMLRQCRCRGCPRVAPLTLATQFQGAEPLFSNRAAMQGWYGPEEASQGPRRALKNWGPTGEPRQAGAILGSQAGTSTFKATGKR